jgi:hypothetical protein
MPITKTKNDIPLQNPLKNENDINIFHDCHNNEQQIC